MNRPVPKTIDARTSGSNLAIFAGFMMVLGWVLLLAVDFNYGSLASWCFAILFLVGLGRTAGFDRGWTKWLLWPAALIVGLAYALVWAIVAARYAPY